MHADPSHHSSRKRAASTRRRKSGTSPSWTSAVRAHSHPSCLCSPSVTFCGRVHARRRTLDSRSAHRESPRNCSSRLAANLLHATLSWCSATHARAHAASAWCRSRRCECARRCTESSLFRSCRRHCKSGCFHSVVRTRCTALPTAKASWHHRSSPHVRQSLRVTA